MRDDDVVPELAGRAEAFLQEKGYQFDSHRYPMAHEVCPEQTADISAFINRCLPVVGEV